MSDKDRDADFFPDDFKKYMLGELCWERYGYGRGRYDWVFWSRDDDDDDEPALPYETATVSPNFKDKIICAFRHIFPITAADFPFLVQFWAHKTVDGGSFLTSKNQPFALKSFDDRLQIKGLCSYRKISGEYKFYMDDGCEEILGQQGRVFRYRWPESTPYVGYYSIKEYPQLNHALNCQISSSFALPVFEPFGQCVGVLEIVSTDRDAYLTPVPSHIVCAFEKVGLKCFDVSPHSTLQSNEKNKAREAALKEISDVLLEVCRYEDLRLVQAWVPFQVCSDMSCLCMSKVMKECYFMIPSDNNFVMACAKHCLRTGQGVVGRALSSHNLICCLDVTQFSIVEYPLAHYARFSGFRGCASFALCLQSSYTGNDVYIVEFFRPNSYKTDGDLRTSLRKILSKMKKCFKTFKLASGEELTEELFIEVIHFQNGEKLNYVQISQATTFSPRPEPLQNDRDQMMQLDSSGQLSMYATNNRSNVIGTEQSNMDVTRSRQKFTREAPKGEHIKTGVGFAIPLEDILQTSKMKLKDAAINLDDSDATFFPDDFKKYMLAELCWEKLKLPGEECQWVFWSRGNDKYTLPYDNSEFNQEIMSLFKDKIRSAFQQLLPTTLEEEYLVQLWANRTMEGRSVLVSKDQPFVLGSYDRGHGSKGLCSYRKISKEFKFYMDGVSEEGLGLQGRVFLNKLPESTLNVEYYSIKEYPLRDHALRCQIRSTSAFPIFESSGQCCIGVLELVSTTRDPDLIEIVEGLASAFEMIGLKCLDVSNHHRRQINKKNEAALEEISHVLYMVCEVHDLPLAQTWVPCRVCRDLIVDGIFDTSCRSMSTITSTVCEGFKL